MKRFLSKGTVLCFLLIFVLMSGCAAPAAEEPAAPEDGADEPSAEAPEDKGYKIALILNGAISDMGWNASAHNGLLMIEENYNAEVSYTESVSMSDAEGVIHGYAEAGYNVIFVHGSDMQDATLAVAEDYPEIFFIITNGMKTNEKNIACVQVSDEEQGFLMGALAGLMTESGVVGVLGGAEIPPLKNAVKGFEKGALHTNPDVKVLSTMTGSSTDVTAAKETTLAQIGEGADIVGAFANQAGLGTIEAAQEEGILCIGAGEDQWELAPDTVIVSIMKQIPVAFNYVFTQFDQGTLKPEIIRMGVEEGVIYLSPWHNFEDKVPAEIKDTMDELLARVAAGEIQILD